MTDSAPHHAGSPAPGDRDLLSALRTRPMSMRQWLAVLVCVFINMIDGFEILSAGYTAPAIAAEFGLSPRLLGSFLSAGPAGMIVGALAIAPLADWIGRRRLVIACLACAAIGMGIAAAADGVAPLFLSRIITGVGVGAMMVAVNTVVAEVGNDSRRDVALVMQATGFPLGGAVCGLLATMIAPGEWRSIYAAGALAALALLPCILALLPESIEFLSARKPAGALRRLQTLARRYGLPVPNALPEPVGATRSPLASLATPRSLAICASFFLMMLSFYFLTSWTPKLLAQAGQSGVALSGAALMSAGGVLGDLAFGALSLRWRAATVGRLFAVACFGSAATLGIIASLGGGIVIPAFLLGFFLYGTMACHYAVVPAVYPGAMRASGTGLAVGMGRVGAAIGPLLGGILLSMDMPVPLVTAAMTMPVLICGLLIALLGRAPRPSRP